MSRICLRTICISRLPQAKTSSFLRGLHTSTPCKVTAVLTPSVHDLNASPTKHDSRELVKWRKLEDLQKSLDLESVGPRRVWYSYLDLLSFLRPDQIPQHVHQKVLRRCTTSLDVARYDLVLRMQKKERIRASHLHETRFQTVIYNMRQAGYTPDAEDYYFILQHFAAVGHHIGALQVLKELPHVGLEKTAEAYRLCLEALDRRLTLPCWHDDRPKLAAGISRLVFKILGEMQDGGIQMTRQNVDLCFRILGEGLEDDAFEKLMRQAYGIDLNYPDRPPLEFWSQDAAIQTEGTGFQTSTPYPFTTSALNNTINFLGRKGRISKLVQAFEVLTTPLPTHASTTRDSSYFDDEDEDFGYDHPEVAPYSPPHAEPNTETYTRLIRWLCHADHAPLARHYLYQAYRLDRKGEHALRRSLLRRGVLPEEIRIPRCRFTSKMLHSVFGLTNRGKKLPMMRWLLYLLYQMKRQRRSDILFYRGCEEKWRPSASKNENDAPSDAQTAESALRHQAVVEEKLSDLNMHLCVLRREYSRLLLLELLMTDTLGRQTQRMKERLGRRVWNQKDIYLRTQEERVIVSKEQWRTLVRYRNTRRTVVENPEDEPALGLPNPHTPIFKVPQLGFFTPSTSYRVKPEVPIEKTSD